MNTEGQRTARLHVPELDDDVDVMGAAFAYAKHGWYVGPIDQGKKHAGSVLGKGWPAKTSRDPQDIGAWFAGTDYGLMLHVGRSGAVAFDVDHFDQVPDVLRAELDRGDVPYQSTRANDPGRGHYLFEVPAGRQLGNARGDLKGGWGEIRGRNGIIVVQPTRHEKADQGARYQWVTTGPVPTLPAKLAAMLPDALAADDAASDAEVAAFLDDARHSQRTKSHLLGPVLRRFADEAARGASRHETALGCAVQILKEARAGYYPADEGIRQLRQAFIEAVGAERNAASEFDGVLSWATAQAGAASLDDVKAITARTAQSYLLGAKPATPAAAPPESVEEALDVTAARKAADAATADPAPSQTDSPTATSVPEPTPAAEDDDSGPITIDVTNEPTGIVALVDAINRGVIPDTYVRNGDVVRVGQVSGRDRKATAVGSTIDVQIVDPDVLRLLLAQHADVIRWRAGKKDEAPTAVPASPSTGALKSVVAARNWPKLPTLAGVVTAPVLRPDGTLLQEPGYDAASGLYYAPAFDMPAIPDDPSRADVDAALGLVVDVVLGDFPWKDASDLANYLALLMTPILRPYVGGLSPLGAISASERGSGKTLLTTVIGALFRMTSRPWVSSDQELRKAISTVLTTSTKPVILFDNVGDHDAVKEPSLAKVLTSDQWDDRKLGGNEGLEAINDRLWLVTGNSIEFGGDIAGRTVLVRLDPKCPDPDLRSGFTIPDLQEWIEDDTNRAQLLRALLILARSWISAGAPREEFVMRGFRRWACAMGGLLMHHGIGKFLANREELKEHDEEASTWATFLTAWYRKFGTQPISAADLRKSAEVHSVAFGVTEDPWAGTFITRSDGITLPATNGLGMMLKKRRDRFYGGYTLRGELDHTANTWLWAVYPQDEAP